MFGINTEGGVVMEIRVTGQRPWTFRSPLLLLPAFQGARKPDGYLKALDEASQGLISRVLASGDFRGKWGETLVQHTFGALPSKRVMFLGMGELDKWSLDRWRGAVARGAQAARSLGVRRFGVSLKVEPISSVSLEELAGAAVEGMALGLYRFKGPRKEDTDREPDPDWVTLLPGTQKGRTRIELAVREALCVSEAVRWVRDLVSEPSNRMTPTLLAARAVEMARQWGIKHHILEEEEIASLGMGGLLGVASGSKEPPRLIILEHEADDPRAPKVALVGKGITFDSGGISLKPAQKMDQMKTDMAGGAAVLGTIQAAARLRLPVNLVGVVPATENLPSGRACKPGDVLTTLSGRTIEVVNTDAEGRVILADALSYALRFEPELIIDLATLTGACIVALGDRIAGMMGNASGVLEALRRAGESTGEAVWPLPLPEDYEEYIKSDVADVKNSGGREAGTIQGGLFLQRFVEGRPWVHLDVAGPVWTEKDRPYTPKGATGFGVRLLVAFLKEFKGVLKELDERPSSRARRQ